ncbi:hypothetical protein BDZ89DRAFT_1162260 [Hymenopellis radicata]|nr:hypothetical protein BDZ89DRAFT_1162260 [Hymenopellis radicata]
MAMAQSTTEVRFPPFPAGPPPGVTIIPFTEWHEIGILRETSDEIERDSLNIPTVPMPSAHATDVPKTNARQYGAMPKSRKGKKAAAAAPGKEWHEEWVGQENYLQPGGYAPMLVTERLLAASEDFVRSRNWPKEHEANSPLSIRNQYDQLRIFIGLIASQQDQNQKKKVDATEDMDELDEEDEYSDEGIEGAPVNEQENSRPPHSPDPMADKLWAFCDDPEERVTVFLSQMMFTKGWIYSDRFLFSIPRLVRFFLIFLLKNKVLESEAKVKRALKIAEIAVEELPLISKIAKVFPDALNSAFLNCFEIRPDVFFPEGDEFATSQPPAPAPLPEEIKQEDKVEEDVEMKATSAWGSTEGTGWDTSAGDGWGASGNGWDTSKDIGWAAPVEDETPAEWAMPVPKCLMTFLGATALPFTHTTGIVEHSTRRITKIIPPTLPPKSAVSSKPSPDAIEAELEQKFTRVVFSPWDGDTPTIHRLSKGAVLPEGEGGPVSSAGNPKPHNPWKDDITVLVEHDTAKVLSLGMGIGGWFVQIARQDDFEVVDEKKPKKKSKRGELRFWYLAGLTLTLMSYHVMKA